MAEVEVSKTTTTETRNEGRTSSLLTDILTIVGFAILFIIIIWGFVHLVSLIYTSLSSKFSNTAPSIEVTAPAQATSGQPMTISWTYSPSVQGSYAFLYQCENGLSFDTKGATSSVAVPCGEAYTVGNVNNSLTLTPLLSSASTATDTVSIVFIPSGTGSQAQGDATVAISAAAKSAPAKTTPAKTTSSATYTAPQYSGPTDLSVRIISGNVDASGAGVVTFDIANIGGSASGSYYFTAQLPTAQPYPYQSPLQASLEPGGHVTSTLRFTSVQSGGGTFSVSIQTNDANNADNYASMQLTAPYNYNNYNYNYSYPYNYQSSPYIVYPTYTY
ncbi:MAG TPA: hypothetical protein VMH91_03370 [Candidatus Paceibacterota bacterium]|nr:hypothetical protein [Candidatus Paceibacterota bacterium]